MVTMEFTRKLVLPSEGGKDEWLRDDHVLNSYRPWRDPGSAQPPLPAIAIPTTTFGMNSDVWLLILRQLGRNDLASLARVSKNLNSLATPFLYSSITFGWPQGRVWWPELPSKWIEDLALARRLIQDPKGQNASSVLELELRRCPMPSIETAETAKELLEMLPKLILSLPNLKYFKLQTWTTKFTPGVLRGVFDALNYRSHEVELHLIDEDGSRTDTGPLPSVTYLRAKVNPEAKEHAVPNVQTLFFNCANLKRFTFLSHKDFGGCVVVVPNFTVKGTFQLTGAERFPPLEHLRLDNVPIPDEEWVHWRAGLNWKGLKSLELGPWGDVNLIGLLAQPEKALRSLRITAYADEAVNHCQELEQLLMSFNTLESLTILGHSVKPEAIMNHANLEKLELHTVERSRETGRRPILEILDLKRLDAKCPRLESLIIDAHRTDDKDSDDTAPHELLMTLAAGFANLQYLQLHFEIGIDWDDLVFRSVGEALAERQLKPLLTKELVEPWGREFFAARRQPSKLEELVLRTGEGLRRYMTMEPSWRMIESNCAQVAQFKRPRGPGDAPELTVARTWVEVDPTEMGWDEDFEEVD